MHKLSGLADDARAGLARLEANGEESDVAWALQKVTGAVGPEVLAYLARGSGVELRFEAAGPAWPLGLRARRLEAEGSYFRIPLEAPRLILTPRGLSGRAAVDAGTVDLRWRWTAGGVLRFQGINLETVTPAETAPLPLAGRLDGTARKEADSRFLSVWVTDGSVLLTRNDRVGVPFGLLVLEAVERKDRPGRWALGVLHLEGPSLTLEGSGVVLRGGRLRARLEVTALDEPVRTAFEQRGLPTHPLPVELALRGTVLNPLLEPVSN